MIFSKFGRDIWEWVKTKDDLFGFEESEEIMEIAHKHGLVKRVIYDPEKHGEVDADPGDEIWYSGDNP